MAEVAELVVIFQYLLTAIQNLGNPWVFFPIIVYLTGYFAWKLELGLTRNWKGMDYYLAIFAIGFAMQSFSLTAAFVFAELEQLLGVDFSSLFALSLFACSFSALALFLFAKLEDKRPFLESYRKMISWFWIFVAVTGFGTITVPLMIAFAYPTYLSVIILPGWSAFAALFAVFIAPLNAFVILLNRWFILPRRPSSTLHPFSKRELRATFGQRIARRKADLIAFTLAAVLIASVVGSDTAIPLLTPKVAIGQINADDYSNHFQPSKVKYLLLLVPAEDGHFAPHLYELHNVTVTMTAARYGLERCVRYSNPAGTDYTLYSGYPIFNYDYFSRPSNYLPLEKLLTNTTIVTSWPNASSTMEISQCVPGMTTFYFWKKISVPNSIWANASCVYYGDNHTRFDSITITNSDRLAVLLGGIKINYLVQDSPVVAEFIINGRNVTGFAGGVMNYGIVAVPFYPLNDLSTQTAYTIQISYSSYFNSNCLLR